MFGLFVVLRVIAFLLDLVLMSLMSILISGNTPTLVNFDLGILLTARVAVNIIIRRERDIEIPPAAAINALLQPTPAPQDGKCLICHIKDFFEPRKLSCGDVFCRECALLMLCKRDTCPKCGKIPLQLLHINIAVPFRNLVAVVGAHALHWLKICLVRYLLRLRWA